MRSPVGMSAAWAGVLAALSPVWFVAVAAVFASARPDYEFRDAISRLGEQGSPNGWLFQIVGFGGSAVLDAFFAAAIAMTFGTRNWAFRLAVLQVLALIGTALFPCDPGAPLEPTTTTGRLHNLIGLTYFVWAAALPFAAAATFRNTPSWNSIARLALVAGVALVLIFFSFPLFVPERWGIWQRLFAAVRFVWLAAVAFRLRAEPARQRQAIRDEVPSTL